MPGTGVSQHGYASALTMLGDLHLNLVMSSLSGPFSWVPGAASTAYSFQRLATSSAPNTRIMWAATTELHCAWCSMEMRLLTRMSTHCVLEPVLHSRPRISA